MFHIADIGCKTFYIFDSVILGGGGGVGRSLGCLVKKGKKQLISTPLHFHARKFF